VEQNEGPGEKPGAIEEEQQGDLVSAFGKETLQIADRPFLDRGKEWAKKKVAGGDRAFDPAYDDPASQSQWPWHPSRAKGA
jgi:hypothetical protein